MKVLYIDPISSSGHINYNKILLNNIREIADEVSFVFKEGYGTSLDIEHKDLFEIPGKLYSSKRNGLVQRISFWRILRYIKKQLDLKQYDYVILSSYEGISLYLSFFGSELLLVNHNNVQGLDNFIKRFVFKRLSIANTHIVLNRHIQSRLEEIGVNNSRIVSHGLPEPIDQTKLSSLAFITENISDFKEIIFVPSGSSTDSLFINELIKSESFLEFLRKSKILLIVKGNYFIDHTTNIIVLRNYLSEIEYQSLFMRCSLILLPYKSSFEYRVSGVFFECVANNKPCLMSKINALEAFGNNLRLPAYFTTPEELQHRIEAFYKNDHKDYFVRKEELNLTLDWMKD